MPDTIDVTGLPQTVIEDMRRLVATLRQKFSPESPAAGPEGELPPDEWIARLQAWSESHPKREIIIDDSRETIYGGRGE